MFGLAVILHKYGTFLVLILDELLVHRFWWIYLPLSLATYLILHLWTGFSFLFIYTDAFCICYMNWCTCWYMHNCLNTAHQHFTVYNRYLLGSTVNTFHPHTHFVLFFLSNIFILIYICLLTLCASDTFNTFYLTMLVHHLPCPFPHPFFWCCMSTVYDSLAVFLVSCQLHRCAWGQHRGIPTSKSFLARCSGKDLMYVHDWLDHFKASQSLQLF